jgi:hypothetical protein
MGKVCNAFCGLSAGAAWILCSILSTSAGCEGDAASKKDFTANARNSPYVRHR